MRERIDEEQLQPAHGERGRHGRRGKCSGSAAADTACGRVLQIINTHLIFNPKRGDIKLLQLAMLLNRAADELKADNMTSTAPSAADVATDPNDGNRVAGEII